MNRPPLWQLLGVLGMILAPLAFDHAIAWVACAFGLVIGIGAAAVAAYDWLEARTPYWLVRNKKRSAE